MGGITSIRRKVHVKNAGSECRAEDTSKKNGSVGEKRTYLRGGRGAGIKMKAVTNLMNKKGRESKVYSSGTNLKNWGGAMIHQTKTVKRWEQGKKGGGGSTWGGLSLVPVQGCFIGRNPGCGENL